MEIGFIEATDVALERPNGAGGLNRDFYLWEHAHVHAAAVAPHEAINLEDLICDGLSADELRAIPEGQANSVVWLIWHMARCEDVGINVMLDRRAQILDGEWLKRMRVENRDIGTGHSREEVARISEVCDIETVRAYRQAVGTRTRAVIDTLDVNRLGERVTDDEIAAAADEGTFHPAGGWVADFWRNKERRFFLWLGTGHNYMHFQEASVIRGLLGRGFGL